MSDKKEVPTSIKLPASLKKAARIKAAKEERTLSQVIRWLLSKWVKA